MTDDRFSRLRAIQAHAYAKAPAIRAQFDDAGLRPEQLREGADLARLPIYEKDAMIDAQRGAPPLGAFSPPSPAISSASSSPRGPSTSRKFAEKTMHLASAPRLPPPGSRVATWF